MSNSLKKLAGQTVIYGLSTILPKFLNYLLTPLLTYIFSKPVDFAVNTELYAYISFLNIVFTYGMETAFFNFASKTEHKGHIYNTALSSLVCSTAAFSIVLFLFSGQIASALEYDPVFIYWCIGILASDALMAIPFANLRLNNQAKRFAIIKTVNVVVNVGLNVFYFVFCKNAQASGEDSFLASLYNPEIGIGYGFLANLLANLVSLLLLGKNFGDFRFQLDKGLWREMLKYAWPLLILGLAGMVNETFDRLVLDFLLPTEVGKEQVGIYGACYKISILMTIFIQAFKYAAEPFFFNNAKDKDSKKMNALVVKYFVIFCSFLFLATMMNLPWIKYFVSPAYWQGLGVVPILLLANLCLGTYYNLSIWFKLTGQTRIGAVITIIGAVITLSINFAFIPTYGFMACAWATLASYASMMLIAYFMGKKYYPIRYNIRSMAVFFGLALGLYFLSKTYSGLDNTFLKLALNNLWIVIFAWLFYKLEFPNLKKLKSQA